MAATGVREYGRVLLRRPLSTHRRSSGHKTVKVMGFAPAARAVAVLSVEKCVFRLHSKQEVAGVSWTGSECVWREGRAGMGAGASEGALRLC